MKLNEKTLYFLVPGDIDTRTGGYRYDKQIIAGLRESGWMVHLISLPGEYPFPDNEARKAAADQLALLPDNCHAVIDCLAYSVLPDQLQAHAQRVHFIALLHHPLSAETGLEPSQVVLLHELETRALALADKIITTSPSTAASLPHFDIPEANAAVVCPGTDSAPLAKADFPAEQCNLLCVATLSKRKGHTVLLDALKIIESQPWRLVCAGSTERDPDTFRDLTTQCELLGLTERVVFTGELDDEQLNQHYLQASVFVLASFHEGYGMVLDEAIAYGLPIVATRGGAIADTLPEHASLLVPPGDSVELANALQRFMTDTQLRAQLREGALEARQMLRSWKQATDEFESVLLS